MRILFCNFEYPPLGGGGGVMAGFMAWFGAPAGVTIVVDSKAAMTAASLCRRDSMATQANSGRQEQREEQGENDGDETARHRRASFRMCGPRILSRPG